MGKIEKLNKEMEKLENKIYFVEGEIDQAKQDLADKLITKAEFTMLKQKSQTKMRGLKTSIGKKEKARVMIEKKIREKEEKKAEKRRQREQE